MANMRLSLDELIDKSDMDLLFHLYGITIKDFASYCRKHPCQISSIKTAHRTKKPKWFIQHQISFFEMVSGTLENREGDSREVREFIEALLNLTDYILIKYRERGLRERIIHKTMAEID